jgi:hypothetical protein
MNFSQGLAILKRHVKHLVDTLGHETTGGHALA